MSEVVDRLVSEVVAVMVAAINTNASAEFDELAERLVQFGPSRPVEPLRDPVVDEWLHAAIDAAPEPWAQLASLLGEASPELPWLMSYPHLESSSSLEAFRSHYSYQLLAGPAVGRCEPPVVHEDLILCFSLQAPNVLYPQHHHDAPEIYGIISGTLDWQVGETWSTKGPGDVIIHRSHESHSMRTNNEPVLTWVAWSRDPDSHVFMPSMDPADNTMDPITY